MICWQYFDGNISIQVWLIGLEHGRHTTSSNALDDTKLAQRSPDQRVHIVVLSLLLRVWILSLHSKMTPLFPPSDVVTVDYTGCSCLCRGANWLSREHCYTLKSVRAFLVLLPIRKLLQDTLDYPSSRSVSGSSTSSLTLTKNCTASRPSTIRWS